jgi:hypothetical protein
LHNGVAGEGLIAGVGQNLADYFPVTPLEIGKDLEKAVFADPVHGYLQLPGDSGVFFFRAIVNSTIPVWLAMSTWGNVGEAIGMSKAD